jgi:hypothetical protein
MSVLRMLAAVRIRVQGPAYKSIGAGRKAVTAGQPPARAVMFLGADADAGVVNGWTRRAVRRSKAAGRSDAT